MQDVARAIEQASALLMKERGHPIPAFYAAFMRTVELQRSQCVSALTTLYGCEELLARQLLVQQYLPNYLLVGDNGGDYGILVRLGMPLDERVYICPLGSLSDEDVICLARDIASWSRSNFDTEQFLAEHYESRVSQPRAALQQQIRALSTRLDAITAAKDAKTLSLKSFLLEKRAITAELEPLHAQLQRLTNLDLQWKVSCRQLEQRYRVCLPAIYKAVASDGLLAYADAFGPRWYAEHFPQLQAAPPFLLYARDFELCSLRDVFDQGALLVAAAQPARMLPFAATGAGDLYAFAFSDEAQAEPAIVLWTHEGQQVEPLARTLQEFVFFKMLEMAAGIRLSEDLLGQGNVRENLLAWLNTHERYLQHGHAACLRDVYTRELVRSDDAAIVYLLSPAEYTAVLAAAGLRSGAVAQT